MPDNIWHRRIMRTFGGMAIGFVIVSALTWSGALKALASWRAEELVSTALAGLILMVSVISGVGTTNAKSFRILTDEGLGDPVEPMTLSLLRRQALVGGLFGLMLLVPPIALHAGWTGTAAVLPIVLLILMTAWQTWLHTTLMRDGDELSRAVMVESGYASSVLIGLALFGWAALEKLALLPALDSWTMLTALIVLSLIASLVVSVRRGLVGR